MILIKHAVPQNDILSKYINSYYFIETSPDNFTEFRHYPHYRTTLNIHFQTRIELNEGTRMLSHHAPKGISTVFTNNCSPSKNAVLKGQLNIIGVNFTVLGINYFLKENFCSFAPQPVMILKEYWTGFNDIMLNVFGEKEVDTKVELMDDFFLKQLTAFDESRIIQIINVIMEYKGNISQAHLDQQFGINRRTVLRLFRKHLGCSIEQFRQVVKFRTALDDYLQRFPKPSFTELAYDYNYYDQSDFIKHFKKKTGQNPKQVFSNIQKFGERDLYWTFK